MQSQKDDIVYVVMLRNKYLLFFQSKPKKKGHFLSGVKLFQTPKTTSSLEISQWISNKYSDPMFTEIEDWD